MITNQLVPMRRDLDLLFAQDFSPAARSAHLAERAEEAFTATDAYNLAIVGQRLRSATFVDGRETNDLRGVRPDGTLSRVYDLMPVVLTEIGQLLWDHSPVKSGAYQESHRLLADGIEIGQVADGWTAPNIEPSVRELLFIPTVPYARLIEPVDGRRAWSSQAPDGVYHVIADMAQAAYGSLAKFAFGYRELAGTAETITERRARPNAPRDLRQPALIIQPLFN